MSAAGVRNIVIILALAAAVVSVPGGRLASQTLSAGITVVFLGALALLASRLYRQRRFDLLSLPLGSRALLYSSVAAVVLLLTALTAN